VIRIVFTLFVAAHGLIHLLGFAKAFRFADLSQLTQPISPLLGVLWLSAGLLFMSTAMSLILWPHWWRTLGTLGLVASTMAIVPSWADARAGGLANLVVAVGVAVGFLVHGPCSRTPRTRRRLTAARP
jgi:hypothetical protein